MSATIAAWHGEPVPRYEEGAFRYLVARESIGVLRDYVKRAGALCLRDSAPCDHRMRTAELDYRIDHAPDTDALVEDLIAAFQTRTTCPARTAGGAP